MPAACFTRAFHSAAPEIELIEDRCEITDAQLAEIDVVRGWRFSPGVTARLPRLKWVCSVAAGSGAAAPRGGDTRHRRPAGRARVRADAHGGSCLINIARGAQVVEQDLIDAVQSGHLAGAALDVQRREPRAVDDPLWSVPGITITPHIAAQSAPGTIAAQFVEGLRCLQRREASPRQVDRARG